jgi:DNA topoisomerase VI subunit B
MDINEIKTYLDTNKDNEEVKSYIGGFVTSDRVNSFLEGEDGKKLLQPKLDSYHGKGLETWKTNNLNKLVDEEVKKRFPQADPKDVELNKMKLMIEKMQKDTTKKELTNKALKIAQEKKLPSDLIDYFIGNDEESTVKNLGELEKIFSAQLEAAVAERMKGSGYIPPKGGGNTPIGIEALKAKLDIAIKAGNTALVVSLQNKIFEEQNKK